MEETKKPSMAEMSGETSSSPRLVLNEIMFNGSKGSYFLVDKISGLSADPKDGKKKYAKEDLGEKIDVIFLRIRRKLRQYRKGENPLTTNEHNTKFDMLTLFGGDRIEKGSNDDLRAKYQGLKTMQIVYCLLLREGKEPEMCRMNVKGASLGSEQKAKDVHSFYSYISSFKNGGQDLHFYDFITELSGVEEESDMGKYYAMNFVQGRAIDEGEKALAESNLMVAFQFIKKSDEYYKTKGAVEIQKEVVKDKEADIDTIEYPTDDEDGINPEDIPF